jgi:hypothetical protein
MFSKTQKFLAVCLFVGVLTGCGKDEPEPNKPITVEASDMQNTNAPDKTRTNGKLANTLTSVPEEGEDKTWDYSGSKSATPPPNTTVNLLSVPTNTAFSSATYTTLGTASLGAISFNSLRTFYEISATGIYELGGIVGAQTLNLPNNVVLTSVGNEGAFAPKDLLYKLPLAYNDSYTSTNATLNENYILTVPAFSISQAPVVRRLTRNRTAKVTGWGKLKLPDNNNMIEVLQVKISETGMNNYFLNGNTPPAQLLTAFGLVEGSSTTVETYTFISKTHGIVLNINYENASGARLVTSADYKIIN